MPNEENVETKVEEDVKEEVVQSTETSTATSFNELLKSNKEYQGEFDRRLAKALDTAKANWQKEYDAKIQEKDEALKAEQDKSIEFNAEYKQKVDNYETQLKSYQSKLLGYEKGIKAENINDVISLANNYVSDDTSLDQAIDKVIEKYPIFSSKPKIESFSVGKDTSKGLSNGKTPAQEYLERTRKRIGK